MATIVDTDTREQRRTRRGIAYTVKELATLLKCSERHIRNMADAGTLPGIIRFGRLVRFHRDTVDSWLAEQAKGGRSDG